VKIQALSFSADESMLASLGGQDDNSLVSTAAVISLVTSSIVHCSGATAGAAVAAATIAWST
jgi:hypothetical protein